MEGEGGAGFQQVISALFMFLSSVFGVGRPGTTVSAPAHKVAGCGLRAAVRTAGAVCVWRAAQHQAGG